MIAPHLIAKLVCAARSTIIIHGPFIGCSTQISTARTVVNAGKDYKLGLSLGILVLINEEQ